MQFAILGKRTLQMQVLLKETGHFQIKISRHAEYEGSSKNILEKMLKTSALKRSLLMLCYLQFDEEHWLMKR